MTELERYKAIYFKWHNPLCNYAMRFLKDRQQASDIVQDVFLYVWERREKLDLDSNIKSYLFQTTYHRCLNLIEEKKKINLTNSETLEHLNKKYEPTFQDEAETMLRKERIMKSLRQLPPKCKEVFVLSRQNGLTYGEIAESLGISKKTVENHMVKALSILRNHLKTI